MMKLWALAIALLTLNIVVDSHVQIGGARGPGLYYIPPLTSHPVAQAFPNNCSQCFTRIGKSGPRGLPGPVGATGPPGSINVTVIDNLQEQMTVFDDDIVVLRNKTEVLETENEELAEIIESNQVEIKKLETENEQIIDQLRCSINHGGGAYEGKCYFLLDDTTYDFTASKSACSNYDADFASITSVGAFDVVGGYLRGKIREEGLGSINVRIGMTYDPLRGGRDTTALDGTRVDLDKWYPGRPLKTSASSSYTPYTTLYWYVHPNPDYSSQGFFNVAPTTKYRPLCVTSI